jgi:hypothetical protein
MRFFCSFLMLVFLGYHATSFGQLKTVVNPHFEIINMDIAGKVTPVAYLLAMKIDLNSSYQSLYTYDFNQDGVKEELFYSFGSQNFARILWKSENTRVAEDLYNDYFEVPLEDEGFWFYITDIFGDAEPEILIFSIIGEDCFLKIINYSASQGKMVENIYPLSAYSAYPRQLIKSDKVIISPYGSQGLFEEYPLIIR